MKKFILLLISFLMVLNTFAGNHIKNKKSTADSRLVSGQVIDKSTGELIVGAEVIIDNKVVYTDLNGMFALVATANKDILISSVSYNQTKISVSSFSYKTLTIELSSQ